jgi:hypothetical protein
LNNTEFLEIPHLSILEQKIKVVIEYGCSYSSIPKVGLKRSQIDSLIECYGYSQDPSDTPATLKAAIDKKAQEYWANKCKLYSLGKSLPMLSISYGQGESLVP